MGVPCAIVRVPKIWIAHDVGRSINAAEVIVQVDVSIYIGLGEAMMEEISEFEEAVAVLEREMHQLSKIETEAVGVLDEEAR